MKLIQLAMKSPLSKDKRLEINPCERNAYDPLNRVEDHYDETGV